MSALSPEADAALRQRIATRAVVRPEACKSLTAAECSAYFQERMPR